MARDCSAAETSRAKMDDLSDAALEESQASLSFVAASATQNTIFEVLAALRRIEHGTYGICELTGEPIERERLQALPWARYSLKGQKEMEKTGSERKRVHLAEQSFSETNLADGSETAKEESD